MALPSGQVFNSATWATPTTVVVGLATLDQSRVGATLYSVSLADGSGNSAAPAPIGLPDNPACPLILDVAPTRLKDGRLAEARYCNANGPIFTVEAFSTTGTLGPELGDLGRNNPSQISFNPDGSRGVFGTSSLVCAGIGFFGLSGVMQMPAVAIGGGGQAFLLGDPLAASDCTSTGNADDPDWSPDGTTIAFLASPSALGAGNRSDAPYNLELAPAAQLLSGNAQTPVRTILSGIQGPTGMRWSPDGRWIVVSGSMSNRGSGTWLVRVSDGRLQTASNLELRTPSWSPDGTQIAGIDLETDGSNAQASLVLVNLAGVIGN